MNKAVALLQATLFALYLPGRASASSLLNVLNFNPEAIESALPAVDQLHTNH